MNDRSPFEVSFQSKVVGINNLPFRLLMNMDSINQAKSNGHSALWTITLVSQENDEYGQPVDDELKVLMGMMQEIVQKLLDVSHLTMAGITIYEGKFDIMFFASWENTSSIGGELAEMPDYVDGEIDPRFGNYKSTKEEGYEQISNYLKVYQDA